MSVGPVRERNHVWQTTLSEYASRLVDHWAHGPVSWASACQPFQTVFDWSLSWLAWLTCCGLTVWYSHSLSFVWHALSLSVVGWQPAPGPRYDNQPHVSLYFRFKIFLCTLSDRDFFISNKISKIKYFQLVFVNSNSRLYILLRSDFKND